MRLVAARWLLGTGMVFAAASAYAVNDWGDMAVISSTMGVGANRICIGEGLRASDIGCPSYAPSITTAGDVSVTGNLSAAQFIGDGSGLTGITAASSDRIVSGTTSLVAISNTGYISLTQSGVNTGWFNPQTGFVTIGVSSTGAISGTRGYFSGPVAISTTSTHLQFTNAGQTWGQFTDPSGDLVIRNLTYNFNVVSASSGGAVWVGNNASGALTINRTAGLESGVTFRTDSTAVAQVRGLAAGGMRFTNGSTSVEYARITAAGNVGVATATPTAALQVSGTFIVSNSSQVTTPSIYVSSGLGYVGVGTNNPAFPLDVAGISIFRNTIYLTTPGMSSAANIPFNIYVNNGARMGLNINHATGNVALGNITNASQTLHVNGSALITSWTGINFSSAGNVTPTAPLEVSGTISATNLVINGQTITGGGGDRITSGTTSVVVNSATSTISFSTAGSQRMTIDASGQVGVGNTQPSATLDVSGTLKLAGGTGAEPCNATNLGIFRRNPVTGAIQVCASR